MKNNKGVSLITLLVTVIVLVIIASITTYNGVNMLDDVRKNAADEKLKVICRAILKDDTFLNLVADTEITLNTAHFDYMDLQKYQDINETITVKKNEVIDGDKKTIIYTLKLQNSKTDKEYTYEFNYNVQADSTNYTVSFDETAGVNRPLIVEGMEALMPDGVTKVEDLFTSNWYNYKKGVCNFAKMKYQDKIYVWIPRFAYKIQDFYNARKSINVPSTAISIVFLRETSEYMQNDEVMQTSYRVHPAFSVNGIEYSGIWVEQDASDVLGSLTNTPTYDTSNDNFNVHMMTNTELGAALYLTYMLENEKEIIFDDDEYVAASLDGAGVFMGSENFYTAYELNADGQIDLDGIYGDAMAETSWDRTVEEYPTEAKNYVLRKFTEGLFDVAGSDGSDLATTRTAIVVK